MNRTAIGKSDLTQTISIKIGTANSRIRALMHPNFKCMATVCHQAVANFR